MSLDTKAILADLEKIAEAIKIFDEVFLGYDKYDGHHKSSENAFSLYFDHYWGRNPTGGTGGLGRPGVEIFSYVIPLGGGRQHQFETPDDFLNAARKARTKFLAWEREWLNGGSDAMEAAMKEVYGG